MDAECIEWLLEDDNPAVKYRTQTEILETAANKAPLIAWINGFLPAAWAERKGLWLVYSLSAYAECGLTFEDTGTDTKTAIGFGADTPFDAGCGDFMRLRALVRLGLGNEPAVQAILLGLPRRQLPDGGFLCFHRLNKMKHTPKSCMKSNLFALMLCAECAKRGIKADIAKPLLTYFWNHRLFYRTDNPEVLVLNAREGWRSVDTFYPFEPMRVGLQNIVESLCALGYGNDPRMDEAWDILDTKKDARDKYTLDGTLSKSYLPKERVGRPSKWVTFYALLALKEKARNG